MAPIVTSFTRLIEKREEKQYLRVPIHVGDNVETLAIAYGYTRHRVSPGEGGKTLRREVNIIDLALEDPEHTLVGASGSERREIVIHENYATPGYRGVPLVPGTWHLVLGAYAVEEGGCEVAITVTQTPRETVLLRGETHCHTVHSDGWYTVEELLDRARQDRLDYLFVTDHNSMTSNDSLRSTPGLTVLPGVEATYYDGHYNLYGVARPIKTYVANNREDVLAIMREGRANGAIASINHPVDASCGWKLGVSKDVPADLIEIWNGPFTPWNKSCIDLWQAELAKGRVWPAIGGSACHHSELFRTLATPCTFLYSRGRAGSAILEAMKAGHAFIGMDMNAPALYMELGKARMGDVYTGEDRSLQIRIDRLSDMDEIRLIDETGVILLLTPGACHHYETQAQLKESLFVRLEVWRSLPGLGGTLASIGNPIYIRKKTGGLP